MRTRDIARNLRREPTPAERKLWLAIRRDQLGVRFRRQHPIGRYVADFACTELRLVVEVDGGQHAGSLEDAARTAWLEERGWLVLRYWNNEVLENPEGVEADLVGRIAARNAPR
ncbi:MAG TPA: DUF559 domain-containing protein [Deinococcales bacterium]|nr:DUF559 domain-containing protein [Deinococcales bacterium]